ncbi:MAG: ATP-binding protein, partial [Thermomicrobiales bacterium]
TDPVVRLVTICGPDGSGKTAIALETARRAAGDFRDGVAYASLGALTDAALAPHDVAFAFGLRELDGDDPVDGLARALQGHEALLVLDDPGPALRSGFDLARLLELAREVTVLATSNAPLGIAGERVVSANSWATPDGRDGGAPGSLLEYPAIRLVFDRASAAELSVEPTPELGRRAAEIVQLAGGNPLAIELAAARLAARPSEPLPLFMDTDGERIAHEVVAWSAGLLSLEERVFLTRLAVFPGGFGLEAAYRVAGAAGASPGRTYDLVSRLADLRLLTRWAGPAGARFSLPGPVRTYALAELAASGEEAFARRRHLAWAIDAGQALRDRMFFPPVPDDPGPELLDAELDSIRAAFEWARVTGNAAAGMRLLGAVWFSWSTRGLSHEGTAWARQFAPLPMTDAAADAAGLSPMGLMGAGWLAALAGSGEEGETYARLGRALARRNEPDLEPLGLVIMSFTLSAQRLRGEAVAAAGEAVALAGRSCGFRWLGLALNRLGVARENAGDPAGSVAPLDRALAVWMRQGFRWGISTARNNLINSLGQIGDFSRSVAIHREVLARDGAWEAGSPPDPWTVLRAWLGLAEVALAAGDYRRAALLLGAGERFREDRGLILPLEERAARAEAERQLRAAAGAAPIALWLAEGHDRSPEDALAFAFT